MSRVKGMNLTMLGRLCMTFIVLSSLVQISLAQVDSTQYLYDERQWKSEALDVYIEKGTFQYDHEFVTHKNVFQRLRKRILDYIMENFGSQTDQVFSVLEWFLMILAAGVLIYSIIKIGNVRIFSRASAKNTNIKLQDLEEMEVDDLQVLLDRARQERNYKLITRVRFLLVLRKMDEESIIEFREYKTNLDYQLELKNPDLKTDFNILIDWYEYGWYGDFSFNEQLMKKADEQFSAFEEKLKDMRG